MPNNPSMLRAARDSLSKTEKFLEQEVATSGITRLTRRYAPLLFLAGVLFGCLVAAFGNPPRLIGTLLVGGFIGFGVRAYISHQRRRRLLRVW